MIFDKSLFHYNIKTRLFATNSLSFLPKCDRIVILDKGSIQDVGTFKELNSKKGFFSDFIGSNLDNFVNNGKFLRIYYNLFYKTRALYFKNFR